MDWNPASAQVEVGTFMPGLLWACEATRGPILELGAGYFSTPFLHGLDREIFTYEYDPEWFQQIWSRFESAHHHVVHDFAHVPPYEWAVVLIDCEGWNRDLFFQSVRSHAEVLVVHDSQDPWIPEADLEGFRYRADFDSSPRTTLLSDSIDVGGWSRGSSEDRS